MVTQGHGMTSTESRISNQSAATRAIDAPSRRVKHSVPSGQVKLAYIWRNGIGYRKILVAFNIGDDPNGLALHVAEAELLRFPKFQEMALSICGVFVEHSAGKGTPKGKSQWMGDIAVAIAAGQQTAIESVEGFRFGGRQ